VEPQAGVPSVQANGWAHRFGEAQPPDGAEIDVDDPVGVVDGGITQVDLDVELEGQAEGEPLARAADLTGTEADAPGAGEADLDIDVSLLDSIEQELADVERALAMLDDGTYGYCEVCANAIGDADLTRAPASRFCPDHLPLSLS